MFVVSKFLPFILGLLVIFSVKTYAQESSHQIFKICTPDEDCSAVIPANKSAGICEAQPVRVAWHSGSDQYIVQCDCNCTEENNKNWIVDEGGKISRRIDFGRYVTKKLFVSGVSPEVPDKFSSHGMCHDAKKDLIEKSNFIVLDKIPSTGKSDPYCYEPYYIISEKDDIEIRDNSHQLSVKDSKFGSIEKNAVTLNKLNKVIELTK